ncbi:hypothetical protein AM1BK_26720 [Neobacillus kokaensis]|uniref:Uncharacterized protein n=1 Tax=Neobacillus kokaensis TaxID=2759023 RepID=A0ABQ3N3D0_9BACI|nr:hypothetical protein AM1BK_26720 [Neobacillus kokaensis]
MTEKLKMNPVCEISKFPIWLFCALNTKKTMERMIARNSPFIPPVKYNKENGLFITKDGSRMIKLPFQIRNPKNRLFDNTSNIFLCNSLS